MKDNDNLQAMISAVTAMGIGVTTFEKLDATGELSPETMAMIDGGDYPPERREHLTLTESELTQYRQAGGDMAAIVALDKLFFERHATAISFERPCFEQLPKEFAGEFAGRPGRIFVGRISDDRRCRRYVPCDLDN